MLKLILIAVAIFILFLIILCLFASHRLIFFPSAYPDGDWNLRSTSSVSIQEVELQSAGGKKLYGWFSRPKNARATFLFLHGNAGNVTHRIHFMEALAKLPVEVLVLDYSGYGKSEGSPSEAGCYADAETAYRWLLTQGIPAERIVLFGESLGGAVAVELATRVPVAGLVLQATFTSVGDMAKLMIPVIPLGWLIPVKFKSVEKVPKIVIPKLFFHGKPDEVVPYRLGRDLFEAAAEPKRWVEYPDLHHNEWPGHHESEWIQELLEFLKKLGL